MRDQLGQTLAPLLLKLTMLKASDAGPQGRREQIEELEAGARQLDNNV